VTRTLEAIFRQPMRFLFMLILFPALGVGIAFYLPRTYQSTATLWALRSYATISATGTLNNPDAQNNQSGTPTSPSDTQVSALTELLQSRSFALIVAKSAQLSKVMMQSDPETLNDAMVSEISQHVHVATKGNDTFTISYSNRNPQIAQKVVQAVITTYGSESQSFSISEGQNLLQSYQTQLVQTQQAVDKTTQAQTAYIQAHPNATQSDLLNDPQYVLLESQAQQARTNLQTIQNAISTLNQEISFLGIGSTGLFTVLDPPVVPAHPESQLLVLLEAGGIGLGVALLVCILYLAAVVRRDHAIYTVQDVQKVTTLPVALQIPQM